MHWIRLMSCVISGVTTVCGAMLYGNASRYSAYARMTDHASENAAGAIMRLIEPCIALLDFTLHGACIDTMPQIYASSRP